MEDFREAMTAASSEPTGDTTNVTPETSALETLAAPPAQGEPEPQPSSADTAPATGPEDDLRSYLEKRKAERPELAEEMDRIHREFQSQLTPRLQEASELRKQFEGLDPADAQFLRQVNEMALVDPHGAAQMLENARQQLLGAYAPPVADSEPEGWEFATPMEQRQYQEIQELKKWREQEDRARTMADMERQFTDIGKEFGSEVPYEQRRAAADYCLKNRIEPSQIGLVWKGMYGLSQAKRMGRDEASTHIERKAAIHPGPSGIAMPPPAPPAEATTLREALEQAAGIR